MFHGPQCNSPTALGDIAMAGDKLPSVLFGLYPFICGRCEYSFRARYHPASPSEPID